MKKHMQPEIGKGCFLVSYFNGIEWVISGQYYRSADAGVQAAKIVGTTTMEEVKITFDVDLAENGK